jgi:hypothetical protein
VTAYHGAAPLINNSAVLSAAAGLLGTEAYHAGAIRALAAKMAGQVVFPYGVTVAQIFGAISDLRNTLGGSGLDQGLLYSEGSNGYPVNTTYNITTPFNTTTTVQDPNAYYRYINLVPTDSNSLPFSRTAEQVLRHMMHCVECCAHHVWGVVLCSGALVRPAVVCQPNFDCCTGLLELSCTAT